MKIAALALLPAAALAFPADAAVAESAASAASAASAVSAAVKAKVTTYSGAANAGSTQSDAFPPAGSKYNSLSSSVPTDHFLFKLS